jgi:hypothetical protein
MALPLRRVRKWHNRKVMTIGVTLSTKADCRSPFRHGFAVPPVSHTVRKTACSVTACKTCFCKLISQRTNSTLCYLKNCVVRPNRRSKTKVTITYYIDRSHSTTSSTKLSTVPQAPRSFLVGSKDNRLLGHRKHGTFVFAHLVSPKQCTTLF